MKTQNCILAVFSALLLSVSFVSAQPYGSAGPYTPHRGHRPLPGTILGGGRYAVSNHSLSAQVLGLEYSFEGAVAGNFTIIGRAGLVPTGIQYVSSLMGGTYANFAVGLGLTLEPRIYTSFDRRSRLGRSTYMNSSDFVAFRTQAIWAKEGYCLAFTPLYGMRRTTSDHWAHELTFGPRLAYTGEGNPNLSPHLMYRLIFMF